jgi:hypothetical protein
LEVLKLLEEGKTILQISKILGIHVSMVYHYKKVFAIDFFTSLYDKPQF